MKIAHKILICFFAIFLVGCVDTDEKVESAEPVVQEKEFKVEEYSEEVLNKMEQNLLWMVNKYRLQRELEPLHNNEEICQIARKHSQDMATGKVEWSHDGYDERADAVAQFVRWEELGENLATTNHQKPLVEAMKGWVNSRIHEENMLGDFSLSGIGIAVNDGGHFYITQIFARD